MNEYRPRRLAELLKEEISRLMRDELKDPRVGFASIVDVEVTGDLREARVYVSVMGDDEEQAATLDGLRSATGFVRRVIGERIRVRHTPEIEFRLDKSIARGARINEILRDLSPQKEQASDGADDGDSGQS